MRNVKFLIPLKTSYKRTDNEKDIYEPLRGGHQLQH